MPEAEEPKQVSNNDLRNAQFGGGLINAETGEHPNNVISINTQAIA
jgi:hypothetical protein